MYKKIESKLDILAYMVYHKDMESELVMERRKKRLHEKQTGRIKETKRD